MALSGNLAQTSKRIERACQDVDDSRTLRLLLVDVVRQVIGFDAYAWLLTDPQTRVGSTPLADVPCLAELPELIRLKYLTDVNRWTKMRKHPVALLSEATGGDLSRSLMWREILSRYDIRDVASVVFEDRFGCWAFLDLWRTNDRDAFTSGDVEFLQTVTSPITSALRRCQANTFVARRPGDRSRTGPAVLLLSNDLAVLRQTSETDTVLRMILPTHGDQAPIPAGAYNVAAQLLAVEAGVDSNPASARLHLADGLWITLRAARIAAKAVSDDGDIAVTIEESTPSERIVVFAATVGLSPRETELLDHLGAGLDTRYLARRMTVSEHTIQDHLKSIFDKTSTRHRGALLSRALGT